jgi:hypothetical protein
MRNCMLPSTKMPKPKAPEVVAKARFWQGDDSLCSGDLRRYSPKLCLTALRQKVLPPMNRLFPYDFGAPPQRR